MIREDAASDGIFFLRFLQNVWKYAKIGVILYT